MTNTAPACTVCGRPLKNPGSIAIGMGPVCAGNKLKTTRPRRLKKKWQRSLFDQDPEIEINFNWGIDSPTRVLWIADKIRAKGVSRRSLTNNMNNVLCIIQDQLQHRKQPDSLGNYQVIYMDENGVWDRIEISRVNKALVETDMQEQRRTYNPFLGAAQGYSTAIRYVFKHLGERDLETAIKKVAIIAEEDERD